MSENDRYFQFPLCCLAFGPDPETRLRAIVNYCCVEVGIKEYQRMTAAELKEKIAKMPEADRPAGFRVAVMEHRNLVAGMQVLNVRQGSVDASLQNHSAVDSFLGDFRRKHGESPFVRIRTDILWSCINGARPYREFSVLAAVYCLIGSQDKPVRITRDRINAAALGYKSQKIVTPELLALRQDKAQPLTTMQLRTTLNKLEADSLFARVQLSPRRVYFSHRMTRDEMTAALFAVATKRRVKLNAHRTADRELQARIKGAIIVVKPPRKQPSGNQTVTTGQPPGNHGVTTLIETTLKETALKETKPIPCPSGQAVVLSGNSSTSTASNTGENTP